MERRAVTTYDLLKTLAVVTMIIDHVGYFFVPEWDWMRAVGRASGPIWMFLVGYAAQGRVFEPRIWVGAFIVVAADQALGISSFPVNILFCILAARALRPVVGPRVAASMPMWVLMLIACVLFFFPAYYSFDYATILLPTVMAGWAFRHGTSFRAFALASAGLFFAVMSRAVFGFEGWDVAIMAAAVSASYAALWFFRPGIAPFPAPWPLAAACRLCGRKTLEIYVIHIVLFKAGVLALGM